MSAGAAPRPLWSRSTATSRTPCPDTSQPPIRTVIGNIPAMADKRPLRSKAPMTRGARSANPGMAGPQREWPSARHWTARYSRPSLSLRSWNVNPPAEAAVEAITITAAPHSFDTVGRTDGSREGAPPFCHE